MFENGHFKKFILSRMDSSIGYGLFEPFWSLYSERALRTCPRSWFFRYVASQHGWREEAEPSAKLCYALKKLQTVDFAVCQSVNSVMISGFKNLNDLVYKSIQSFNRMILESELETHLFDPVRMAIKEVFYNEEFDYNLAVEQVKLLSIKVYELIKGEGALLDSSEVFEFDVSNVKVFMKGCVVLESSNALEFIHISPYEISRERAEKMAALSAIYAKQRFGLDESRVVVRFLQNHGNDSFVVLPQKDEIQQICEDVEASMFLFKQSIRYYRDCSLDEAFPLKCGSHCDNCNFRLLCPAIKLTRAEKRLKRRLSKLLVVSG